MVTVTLTAPGRRSAARFHAEVTAHRHQLLDTLSPEGRADFRGALGIITHSAGFTASWGGCATSRPHGSHP